MRAAAPADSHRCVAIVAGLPDYFADDVGNEVRDAIGRPGGWVLCKPDDQDRVIGFVVVDRRNGEVAEIRFAAVEDRCRHQGSGTVLIEHVLAELSLSGVRLVEVKTLDAGAGYEPYEATRAFWERRGFVKLDVIDPLPGWQPGNPAAIYVAALTPSG